MEPINHPQIDRTVKVHKTLAYSYSLYLLALLLGVSADFLYPFHIFQHAVVLYSGIILLALATLLILWAQVTNRELEIQTLSVNTFMEGPYKYSRTPTHFGLFFAMLGFGIVSNSVFIVLFTLIAFMVTRATFVKKQESLLAEKYGAPYVEYQKIVKI